MPERMRPQQCGQPDANLWLAGGALFLAGIALVVWAVTR